MKALTEFTNLFTALPEVSDREANNESQSPLSVGRSVRSRSAILLLLGISFALYLLAGFTFGIWSWI